MPHPLGRLVPSLSRAKIDELFNKGYGIDGIEMYNPSPANASMRSDCAFRNQQWRLAETGGSDAHFWQHIGAAYTLFPGSTSEDLRRAVRGTHLRPGGQEIAGAPISRSLRRPMRMELVCRSSPSHRPYSLKERNRLAISEALVIAI